MSASPAEQPTSLAVRPMRLDFGTLKPGEIAEAELTVEGGSGEIICDSGQVSLSSSTFGPELAVIRVRVTPRGPGTLWTKVRVASGTNVVEIPIVALWYEAEQRASGTKPQAAPEDTPERPSDLATHALSAETEPPRQPDRRQDMTPKGPALADSREIPSVLVSKLGRGQYTTIGEAVRGVPAGTRIVVGPGLYRENVAIEKSMEIVGEGARADVVVEGSPCVLMQAEYAEVRGMTLRGKIVPGQQGGYAVDIPRGKLVIERCDISMEATEDDSACVAVHGSDANLTLRDSVVHDGFRGVYAWDSARGIVEDCALRSTKIGAHIASSANLAIRRCQIQDVGSGVAFAERGEGTVEDCEIFDTGGMAVHISSGGYPVVRNCRIHDGKASGVSVTEARGIIEACEIYANADSGILIWKGGDLVIRNSKIREGRAAGVRVSRDGQGRIESCEIYGNAGAGIDIDDGGNLVVRNCKIHDGKGDGVAVQGEGTIEDCEIYANALVGVEIANSGNPVIRNCKIHHGKNGGVLVGLDGQGMIEGCQIYANALAGVEIVTGGNPVVRNCKIHDGGQGGVYVHEQGAGTIEDCEIYANTVAGIEIKEGGNPVVQRNRISGNNTHAVAVHHGGAGLIENNDLSGNRYGAFDVQSGCRVVRRQNREK